MGGVAGGRGRGPRCGGAEGGGQKVIRGSKVGQKPCREDAVVAMFFLVFFLMKMIIFKVSPGLPDKVY